MSKTKLLKITPSAWIVKIGEEPKGILNKDVQEKYVYISGKASKMFCNDEDVATHFGNVKLFAEEEEISTCGGLQYFIKGYEIKHPDTFLIDETHPQWRPDLPLYTKKKSSKVIYAAGYYAINFTHKGWTHAFAPKLETLLAYGFEGPFRTNDVMRQRIRVLNANRRIENNEDQQAGTA